MRNEDKKWDISYCLSNELDSLITLTCTTHPLFDGKEGPYTYEEVLKIGKFIHEYPCPKFNNKLDGWDDFKSKLNEEIYNLFKK